MSVATLIESPSEYDFYQAVYTIERQLAAGKEQQRKVGHDSLPKNELIRFKSDQHLGFPGASVSKVVQQTSSQLLSVLDMHVSFMGVTGTNGALPQHYTELVLERLKYKDTGMRDFFDLFNHRLLSLYYRAWEKYRFPIGFENNCEDHLDAFSGVLNELTGVTNSFGKYYAGIFNRKVRNVAGLKQMLSDFTGCEIDIEQFQGKWQSLAKSEQTQLGQRSRPEGKFSCLGVDASIGQKVWDINSAINIVIKPEADCKINDILHGGRTYRGINKIISQYVGKSIQHKIQLKVLVGQIPVASLSKKTLPLGMGCGLASRKSILKNNISILL
ncbi:type VI secretion system baseplate subunit TssG [Psychromonas antarctica]|uniref:type VI secretion system baseplate subunit TssG n=1 Tax=Psychromonas antarctica TaxID=67573 RepID=UPI001EE7C075|nr:type VI secretion system baseplate subunit TssG [Psychromonas antarctica]MCG6202377.1 type VI secretion system baseplate subunit TssG [Psychromonas antarctica]